jgi:hypothetical protein
LSVTLMLDFVLPTNLALTTTLFSNPIELAPSIWHSGRDTLLQTRLLRV